MTYYLGLNICATGICQTAGGINMIREGKFGAGVLCGDMLKNMEGARIMRNTMKMPGGKRQRMAVGRFQVMATLQAARALVLGLSEPAAKSWGLNRAIFYAAAKRGFKGRPPTERPVAEIKKRPVIETPDSFYLGDEMAYKVQHEGVSYFTIGGKVQSDNDFKRQIESRFGVGFSQAWKEALELIRRFSQDVLLSQKDFYGLVYRPNRDILAEKWNESVE